MSADSRGAESTGADRQWYLEMSNRRAGPFAWAVIVELAQAGALGPDARVWRMGLAGWSPAGELPDLAPLIRAPAPARTNGDCERIGRARRRASEKARPSVPAGRGGSLYRDRRVPLRRATGAAVRDARRAACGAPEHRRPANRPAAGTAGTNANPTRSPPVPMARPIAKATPTQTGQPRPWSAHPLRRLPRWQRKRQRSRHVIHS